MDIWNLVRPLRKIPKGFSAKDFLKVNGLYYKKKSYFEKIAKRIKIKIVILGDTMKKEEPVAIRAVKVLDEELRKIAKKKGYKDKDIVLIKRNGLGNYEIEKIEGNVVEYLIKSGLGRQGDISLKRK
ncbi:MAG: hypothetical protein QXL94_08575 [Candidatus Parvarchaeum sp.]